MKMPSLLMLALAVLAITVAGSAQAKTNEYINCQVDIRWTSSMLAVELSQSTWALGTVAQGGVKDTWFGEAKHGKFWVRNAGDTNAAVFITAEGSFGSSPIEPDVKVPPEPIKFAMAVATNIEDIVPVWNVLNQSYGASPIRVGRFMGTLVPGDYMLFDLRFYAGITLWPGMGSTGTFRLGVYATSAEWEMP